MYPIHLEYKQEIVGFGKKLLDQGLTVGTWGNLSLKDRESGLIYIKPSGMPYEEISPDDVVVVDEEGAIIEGQRRPSIELQLHLAIYANRPDILQ